MAGCIEQCILDEVTIAHWAILVLQSFISLKQFEGEDQTVLNVGYRL
jgi:hypothetical protein